MLGSKGWENPWSSEGVSESIQAPATSTHPSPSDLLLIVFIHGFKGTDTTFADFPKRLQQLIDATISNVVVESIVFPAYETKGELNVAVEHFADWLTTLTIEKEVAHGSGGGAGKAKIVLCGHSMGGLVAADALIGMVTSRPDLNAPLWPNIIACIAFDTPYLGLQPFIFKNSATKALEYVQTARQMASSFGFFNKSTSVTASTRAPVAAITTPPTAAPTSSWAKKWGAPAAYGVGGLLLGGAAAGAAYYQRDALGMGYKWATEHMKYVGTLWDEDKLKERLEKLISIEQILGVTFRDFYTLLPARPPEHPEPRTFAVLPPQTSPMRAYFIPCSISLAEDEIQAHTGMFEGRTNDTYYELGQEVVGIVREAVMSTRNLATD